MTRSTAASILMCLVLLSTIGMASLIYLPSVGAATVLPLGSGRELDFNLFPTRQVLLDPYSGDALSSRLERASLTIWYQDATNSRRLLWVPAPAWTMVIMTLSYAAGLVFMAHKGRKRRPAKDFSTSSSWWFHPTATSEEVVEVAR